MKNILIVTAMPQELQPLVDFFKPEEVTLEYAGALNPVYKMVDLFGRNIYFSSTRIGKVNAAYSTTILNYLLEIDLVLNFGTAGGINEELSILDIVIGKQLAYHDVDVTSFGHAIGQVPGSPRYFIPQEITGLQEVLNTKGGGSFVRGTILSGDQFIDEKEKIVNISNNFDDVYAVEMESTAIVDVCNKMNVKIVVFRGISDLAHQDSSLEFDTYMGHVSQKFIDIVVEIIAMENIEIV